MADGLYLPDGTFRRFSVESLTTELATRQNAGLFLGDVGGWLMQLPDPDPVLRKRGEDAEVLTELVADDQVTAAMLARKYRVLNCPHYSFRAGAPDGEKPDARATRIYERLVADLERTNMRTLISGILDAPFFGMTPLELIWDFTAGWWHLKDIKPRPYHWFAFDQKNNPVFRGSYGWASADPKLLEPGKFVIAVHQPTYDNPYGLRLLSRCLWPVAFKRGGLQFYAKFVERHGLPWVVGNAPSKAERDEKRQMAANLARMVQDCVAVIPAGADVKLLSSGTAQGQLHEDFLARQDRAISKVLMGQTLTIETDGKNSLAATEAHKGVADDIADSDKAMVADVFNEICWLYTRLNAEDVVLAPLFGYEEPEDLSKRADLDLKLKSMGVKWLRPHFENDYGMKPDEFELEGEGKPVDAPSAPQERDADGGDGREVESGDERADFAAPSGKPLLEEAQERLDAAIARHLPDVLKADAEFMDGLKKAAGQVDTLEDFELALADRLSPQIGTTAFSSLLESCMAQAAGYGAAAVNAEAGDADS